MSYENLTKILQKSYKNLTKILQKSYKNLTKILQKSYKNLTKILQTYLMKPLQFYMKTILIDYRYFFPSNIFYF
jgi:hypothetical protein